MKSWLHGRMAKLKCVPLSCKACVKLSFAWDADVLAGICLDAVVSTSGKGIFVLVCFLRTLD